MHHMIGGSMGLEEIEDGAAAFLEMEWFDIRRVASLKVLSIDKDLRLIDCNPVIDLAAEFHSHVAGKLYELLGADTPELAVFEWTDGRTALSSRWVDGLKGKLPPSTISNAEGAYEFFAADAWLANWDVVGAEFDNLVLKGTKAFRVDVGGALRFRAQGGAKGAAFGDEVLELDTLRSGNRNGQAVAVFRDIPDDALLASVRRVLKPSDDQIRQLVEAFGPENKAERDALLKTLLARREYLRKKFPKAAPPQTTLTTRTAGIRTGKIAVVEEDVRAITQARMNGVTIKTDGLDVEDHHVLVAHLTGPQGPMTRTSLKLTEAARARIYKALWAGVAFDAIKFNVSKDAALFDLNAAGNYRVGGVQFYARFAF
jgi:hypothetical protein